MNSKTLGFARGYCIETLEARRLLDGTTPSLLFAETGYPDFYNDTSNYLISSGTSLTISSGRIYADPVAVPQQPTPQGTVTIQWFGGKVIGTYTLGFGTFGNIPVGFDADDWGTPIPSGPYVGGHVLDFSYSGDSFFAPTHVFSSSDFANLPAPGTQNTTGLNVFIVNVDSGKHRLSYLQSPSNAAVNGAIAPPVTVRVLDNKGVPLDSATDVITLSLSGGDGTGTLSGNTTESAVAGVATFSDLKIDKAGSYQLIASSGALASITSDPFKIADGKLAFIKPPKDGDAGAPLGSIQVALQDGDGKTISTDNSTIVTLSPIGFTGGNPITGNQATLVNGVATFNQVVLKKAGFYQLQADDGADAAATSGKFKVGGEKLVVLKQPTAVDVSSPFPLTIGIVDSKGKLDTNAATQIQLSLNPLTPGTGAQLEDTITAAFVNGKALFTDTAGPSIDTPGKYTLTITEVDLSTGVLAPTETTSAITSKQINVGSYHLVFQKPIKPADVSKPLDFTVAVENSSHKINTKLNDHHAQLSLTAVKEGDGGKLSSYTEQGFLAGVQTFTGSSAPSINSPGFYTITATEVDANGIADANTTPVTSGVFKITGYRVIFLAQPNSIQTVDRPIPFKIALADKNNKIVTNASDIQVGVTSPLIEASGLYTFTNGVIEFPSVTTTSGTRPVVIDHVGSTTLTIQVFDSVTALGVDSAHISGATSRLVKILPGKLVFLKQPKISTDEGPVEFEVGVLTAAGKPDTQADGSITLTASGPPGAAISWSPTPFADGKIDSLSQYAGDNGDPGSTNAPGRAVTEGATGSFTLTATYSSVLISTVLPVTSHPFKVFPRRLTFLTQPTNTAVGTPIAPFHIGQVDLTGTPIPDFRSTGNYVKQIEISYRLASARADTAGTVLGDVLHQHPGDDFSGFHIDVPGVYVLIATEIPTAGQAAATPVTSNSFTVTG